MRARVGMVGRPSPDVCVDQERLGSGNKSDDQRDAWKGAVEGQRKEEEK